MKTPTINSRILKLEVLKGTATRTSVNAVESRTTSLESDVATAQSDISTLQTDVSAVEGDISTLQGNVATLTQGIVGAVSTHNTAPDAHADIRTLVAGKQDSLTISDVGEAMLALATPSGQKIPRVNADGSVVLINVPSGDGVGGSSWYASDDGPPSVDISLSWVSNGDANGVFFALGAESGEWSNPASRGRIRSLASSIYIYDGTDDDELLLTDRTTTKTASNNIANSWFAFDLGVGTTLALDSYSLQGRGAYSDHQLRTWVIQGSNDVHDWNSVGISAATWTTIDSRTNDPTISDAGVWGHWTVSVRSAPYRFIRIMQTGANSSGANYLCLSEVELYGLVSASVAKPAGATGWARNSELIDDATAWMPYYATSALTDGTPIFGTAYDVASAVSTHNTAPDSHADLRTLIGDRALSVHQHARTDLPWVTEPGAALLTSESASVQRTALGMTAWAVAPWTDGTTSDIHEGTQLYFTNARADARIAAQKGQAEGIMPLDSSGKAPLAYMPDALIGQVKFKGVWDAATNSPVLPSATTSMGHYYVTSVAGSYGGIDYGVGDWCISDGTAWGKVDNSDAITSFAGRVGAILPIASDYSSFYLGLHAQADDAARLGGQLPSYYAQAGHVHNYAGSSTPGGAATTALACTGNAATATTASSCTGNSATATTASSCSGNAATATKLATPRIIKIGAKSLSFDGTTDREYTISDMGALGVPDVGSWTPVVTSSTPPSGVTYYWRSGSYTRMGGVCFAWFGVSVSSLGSGGGGDLMITGLPFVCRETGAGTVWMPGGFFAGLVNAIDAYANAIGVNEGTTNAIFGRCNNLGISAIPITDATNSLTVCGLIIYQTAA